MSNTARYIAAGVCAVCSAVLAWHGIDGWGWFLGLAALMVWTA